MDDAKPGRALDELAPERDRARHAPAPERGVHGLGGLAGEDADGDGGVRVVVAARDEAAVVGDVHDRARRQPLRRLLDRLAEHPGVARAQVTREVLLQPQLGLGLHPRPPPRARSGFAREKFPTTSPGRAALSARHERADADGAPARAAPARDPHVDVGVDRERPRLHLIDLRPGDEPTEPLRLPLAVGDAREGEEVQGDVRAGVLRGADPPHDVGEPVPARPVVRGVEVGGRRVERDADRVEPCADEPPEPDRERAVRVRVDRAAPRPRAHEPDRPLELLPAHERLALAPLPEAHHHAAPRAPEVAERDLRHLVRGRGDRDPLVARGRHPLLRLGEAADARGVARRRRRDRPLVAQVERVLRGEAAPLERAARELPVDRVRARRERLLDEPGQVGRRVRGGAPVTPAVGVERPGDRRVAVERRRRVRPLREDGRLGHRRERRARGGGEERAGVPGGQGRADRVRHDGAPPDLHLAHHDRRAARGVDPDRAGARAASSASHPRAAGLAAPPRAATSSPLRTAARRSGWS